MGTFLSGGIDSSIVTLLASEKKKINSFSIDLRPKKYSEITYARLIKNNNITFNSRIVSKKEFKKYFSEMFNYFDEPFADSSFVPFYLLCKYSREKDIKAFLSGDGADELFGGYIWHEHYYKTRLIPGMDFLPRKVINLLEYNLHFGKYFSLIFCSKIERYRRIMFNRFSQKEVDKLLSESTTTSATKYYESLLNNKAFTVESLREIDLLSFLQNDINYKVDMGSMAKSIEVRTPFLDPEVFKVSRNHSFSEILSKEKKMPLKRSFKDILPEKTIHRPKKGFSAPVGEWMLDNNVVLDEDSLVFSKNILNYEEFKKIKYKGNISKIWMILVLEEFLKKNISYISA